jgi:hypothetical protein
MPNPIPIISSQSSTYSYRAAATALLPPFLNHGSEIATRRKRQSTSTITSASLGYSFLTRLRGYRIPQAERSDVAERRTTNEARQAVVVEVVDVELVDGAWESVHRSVGVVRFCHENIGHPLVLLA